MPFIFSQYKNWLKIIQCSTIFTDKTIKTLFPTYSTIENHGISEVRAFFPAKMPRLLMDITMLIFVIFELSL